MVRRSQLTKTCGHIETKPQIRIPKLSDLELMALNITVEYNFGYKLHAVCDKNGIFHSYDFTPANVHDVNYLKDIKHDFKNCLLIGDRGYISKEFQIDLFNYSNITLSVPMRKNQHDFVAFSKTKSKIRKRIETAISQLNGQFNIHINYAKTFQGLVTKIASKITSFTMLQYLNFCFV